MSGTSLDGIDVAYIKTDGIDVIKRGPARTYAYDEAQRAALRRALIEAKSMTDRNMRPGVLGAIESDLTRWHAQAVERFIGDCRMRGEDVDLIGFHGQTVLHRPEVRLTVQLGDGELLARSTGLAVAYDMRADDVAAGGQGAPLVPAYHRALATTIATRPVAFVNIGGVANVTWIGAKGDLMAFDTGPGNALIDDWMLKRTGVARDEGGQFAARGQVNEAVLAQYLGDGFFEEAPPKSLDRNSFMALDLARLSTQDGAATLVEFTARAIGMAQNWFPEPPQRWVICGGGRHNAAIMARLKALLPSVSPCEEFGFDGDAMEAEAWGYLAVRSFKKLPISFPMTTRAPAAMTGGKLAKP